MPLSDRENYLRTATFGGPEWIPSAVAISGASWNQLREEAEEVLLRHPTLFPGFRKGQLPFGDYQVGKEEEHHFTDNWGCAWRVEIDGLEGIVDGHPLADWNNLGGYQAPDALMVGDRESVDWEATRRHMAEAKAAGHLTSGGTPHGFLFMRLYYMRGFENLMMDFATQPPELQQLIDIIQGHNKTLVNQYLPMGVDVMNFAEDLGTQTASVISPATFHKWITPAYKALMQPCKEAGALVALHSDGHVMELIDELIEAGVDIINPQDLCNGIDNLAREVKGRMCIRLDIDRQTVVPYGTPREIHDLIEEEVRKLGSPEGGLEFICGVYPPTPAANLDALCTALEEFRTFWWE